MQTHTPLIWAEEVAYLARHSLPFRKQYLDEVDKTRGASVAERLRRAAMALSERESA